MKRQQEKKTDNNLMDYIVKFEKDPEERKAMQKAIDKEIKKLSKNKETEFAAMFLSAIKF